MKKTSKILSIILAILMVISIISITANATEPTSGTIGGVTWEFDNATGTLTFSGEGGIPSFNYSNHGGVEERPWNSFFYRYTKHIVIGDGIKHIGEYAFAEGSIIETVTIGKNVEYIGYNAFDYCDNITYVYYNGTQEEWNSIEIESYNDDLTSAKLYTSDYKVYSDSGTYGDNIIWVFDASTGTLTVSGTGVMPDDWNMSEILNPIDKYEGTFRPWELYKYDIKKVVVSEGITTIGASAFRYFPNLTEVYIAGSVTKIIAKAFRTSNAITDVYYLGTEEQWNNIVIGGSNEPLLNANIHYNYAECEHKYETTVTAPTCTEQGYTIYTCDCGDSYVDNYVDALGHDMVIDKSIAPDCVNKGLTEGSHCSRCDDVTTVQNVVPALGHSYTSEITTPATHTTTGIMTYTCTCGDSYTEVIAKLEKHNYESVVTAPTCAEQGYTTYTCECSDSYVADYVNATGHTEETIPAVAPTCTETGLTEGAKCSICGETLTEQKELPANGHTPANPVEENYIAPTCTSNGTVDKVVYCSGCNKQISRETVTLDATGHTDNDGDGYCDACNEQLSENNDIISVIKSLIQRIINLIMEFLGMN
jgi:hypothetical protein